VEDALKTRGIIYLNVETSLLFAPPLPKFLATCLAEWNKIFITMIWEQFFMIRVHEFAPEKLYIVWEGIKCLSAGNILLVIPC